MHPESAYPTQFVRLKEEDWIVQSSSSGLRPESADFQSGAIQSDRRGISKDLFLS
jgi:hypothetical protein